MKIGKELSEIRFVSLKMMYGCNSATIIQTFILIQTCFENISPPDFWSLADEYPDLVTRLHTQARLMGSFGLNGSFPWLKDMEGGLCFICKENVENTYHFFLYCPQFNPISTGGRCFPCKFCLPVDNFFSFGSIATKFGDFS